MTRLFLCLVFCGCTSFNRFFDADLGPAHDVRYAVAGATLDATLQVAKVPPLARLAADVTAASVVRLTPWFGKNVDSGFMLVYGASLSEFIGFIVCRGPCHR